MTHHATAHTAPSTADRQSARAPALAALGPATHALLRIGAGLLFLQQGGWPIQNRDEVPLLVALIFAFLVGNGAGPLSVDARLGGARRSRTDIS